MSCTSGTTLTFSTPFSAQADRLGGKGAPDIEAVGMQVRQAPETGKTVDILFSHDTHSHLNTFTTVVEDEETDIGGFARANTLIKAQRAPKTRTPL